MGAQFIVMTTEDDPVKAFIAQKAQDEYDYGHAGYTGTFAEVPGVTIVREPGSNSPKTFPTAQAAEQYCEEHAEKWEPALAVRFKDYDGNERWMIAAFSSC